MDRPLRPPPRAAHGRRGGSSLYLRADRAEVEVRVDEPPLLLPELRRRDRRRRRRAAADVRRRVVERLVEHDERLVEQRERDVDLPRLAVVAAVVDDTPLFLLVVDKTRSSCVWAVVAAERREPPTTTATMAHRSPRTHNRGAARARDGRGVNGTTTSLSGHAPRVRITDVAATCHAMEWNGMHGNAVEGLATRACCRRYDAL